MGILLPGVAGILPMADELVERAIPFSHKVSVIVVLVSILP